MQGNFKLSGFLDFITGTTLVTLPTIHTFGSETASWSCSATGIIILVLLAFSLFIDQEKKVKWTKALQLSNIIGGIFLAISPWLFDFSQLAYLPQLFLGSSILFLELMFKRRFKEDVYLVDHHLGHGH
ncbi:SPW repeat domain-containing protein [Desertivirga brevis]|uniref:SPW repeat domain-containing protein n=1 Tax=Desertivirga brevis TaxID=2810310 RepID=UPI001A964B78|nr:hypothetical protein [Pedobacter sp. SYSU D00873]